MKLLTNKQQELYENTKICYICREKFKDKYTTDKKYKVRDHCHYNTGEYRGPADRICNSKYVIPKENTIILHNGSNYDYHLIIKELTEEFEGQFTCLGENTEKYINFLVPMKRETKRIDKNGEEITKIISYKLNFNDSTKFMASSL